MIFKLPIFFPGFILACFCKFPPIKPVLIPHYLYYPILFPTPPSFLRLEAWRERLIAEGDAALDELLAQHPSADRQHLRQLARNARAERDRDRPVQAYRELFRALRELFADA